MPDSVGDRGSRSWDRRCARVRWATCPSHLIGARKFVNIFFGEPHDILAAFQIRGIEPVFVEVPAGSAGSTTG